MTSRIETVQITEGISLGGDRPVLISGPCVVESYETTYQIAAELKEITSRLDIPFIFKASFDKANRTSIESFRSIGFEVALDVLARIRQELGVPILTDVHESHQVERVAEVADVLQIPAFLCRQTDLLVATGKAKTTVNIKRGQFMSPEDMQYSVDKVTSTGNSKVFLTERGVSFGYHNLVVDMRALPIMRQYAPVVFDATHSVQIPGGLAGRSGGNRAFAPYLSRAAAAVGVDGFFVETHPTPDSALSDGPNMIPLNQMASFLKSILTVWDASQPFIERF